MKTYQVDVNVMNAEGAQTFEIKANSPEEALMKYNNGEREIIGSDIEVTQFEKPEIMDFVEVVENDSVNTNKKDKVDKTMSEIFDIISRSNLSSIETLGIIDVIKQSVLVKIFSDEDSE